MSDEKNWWPYGRAAELLHVLRTELLKVAVPMGPVMDAITKMIDFAEWADEQVLQLYALVQELSIDSVTGLLKVQERKQLAYLVRRALETDGIDMVLSGDLPVDNVKRWVEGSRDDNGVFVLSCDGLGLGYVNKEIGMRGGDMFLRLLADTCVDVLDAWLQRRGARRRASVMDRLDLPSVLRRGGDEFLVFLAGPIVGRAYATRDRLLAAVGQQRMDGLDIAPTMSIGLCSVHAAIAYTVRFYQWRGEPLPEGKALVTQVMEMCLAFADTYSDASKFVEYGLMFAEVWKDTDRVERWMTSKLRVSAFYGLSNQEAWQLCSEVFVFIESDRRPEAMTLLEGQARELARRQLLSRLQGDVQVPGEDLDLDRWVFVMAQVHGLNVAPDPSGARVEMTW